MRKIIKLTESDLIRIIKNKLNEEEEDTIVLSAQEYLQLLSVSGYNGAALEKTRRFRGKKIIVDGSLDIKNTPTKNLGSITLRGALSADYSSLETLKGTNISGHKSYYNTPLSSKEKELKRRQELEDAQERRESGEWDLNNPNISDEGLRANAAFQYLVENADIEEITPEEKEELKNLERRQQEISDRMEVEDDEELLSELESEYDEIQEEIDDLVKKDNDVYGLIPQRYGHYNMSSFKTVYDDFYGATVAVGTEYEADESKKEWVESLLDDGGYRNFNQYTVEQHIDGDEVADYFEDDIRERIYDDPQNYDIERELSKEQEKEIWVLKMEKWVYENEGVRYPIKYPTKEENGTVFDFWDENEEHEFQLRYEGNKWTLYKDGLVVQPGQLYDDEDTQDHQDDRESRISDIEYEIQEIEENPDGDLDEDSVESAVDDEKYEISQNPMRWLNDYDLDMENFINRSEFIESISDDEDYGILNGYDGTYDIINLNNQSYVVMVTDK
jgi:hypothetical protein